MASAVASKGASQAALLKKLRLLAAPSAFGEPVAYALRPASVAAARRLFNTGSAPLRRDDGEVEESSGEDTFDDRRRARDFSVPMFFSADVLDPFGEPTRLGRLLALMEDDAAAAAPWTTGLSSSAGAPRRGWWVAKEDDGAVQLKVAMPGLGKEHVKVLAEKNSLVIKGEGGKDSEDDDEGGPARYSHRIEMPADAFKMDQVKAEMKDGVLRVTVPKIKDEERKDVFQVKVE